MSEAYRAFLSARRAEICERCHEALARAGRSDDEVTVEAVSKTVGPEEVRDAWAVGWRCFGENRPQEIRRKLDAIEGYPEMAGVRLDMIGNLQTNKVNQVLGRVTLIHSISSSHLAEVVSSHALARGITARVLLEANVSGEQSKSGFSPDELRGAMEALCALPGISVEGLMTMAPAGDPDRARRTFSGLRELRDELGVRSGLPLATLSMGMSEDFPIALEEGSTIVRLGRVAFQQDFEPHDN